MVEAEPWGHLDLWGREHYKSTLITFAGPIQETLRNPEITNAVFSHTKAIAKDFLRQIKSELEGNGRLKGVYDDVLWGNPIKNAPKWSEDDGLQIRRKTNPKEQTFEAHGLIDGMPTGAHFGRRWYDDIVTEKAVTSPEMVTKIMVLMQLSQNLGTSDGHAAYVGTRYHFADPYQQMIDAGIVIPRIFTTSHNGRLDGSPVFLSEERWVEIKRTQPRTVAAQHLQNPAGGEESMFDPKWLRGAETRPATLNVYILGDPSKGPSRGTTRGTGDRTAIAVVGVDSARNFYLLDGVRHRMDLTSRWKWLRNLHRHWSKQKGIQSLQVGYERYGM